MQENTNLEYVCLTPHDDYLHEIMLSGFETLQQLAYCAFNTHNLTNKEFTVVCVDACYEILDFIADTVAGKQDWEKYRQEGRESIARAIHTWDFCERLARAQPLKKNEILKEPIDNWAKLIVIGLTGVAVYEIHPRPIPTGN